MATDKIEKKSQLAVVTYDGFGGSVPAGAAPAALLRSEPVVDGATKGTCLKWRDHPHELRDLMAAMDARAAAAATPPEKGSTP